MCGSRGVFVMCQVCVQGVCSCLNSGHIVYVVLSCSPLFVFVCCDSFPLRITFANDLVCVPIATEIKGRRIQLLVGEATFSPVTSPQGLCLWGQFGQFLLCNVTQTINQTASGSSSR